MSRTPGGLVLQFILALVVVGLLMGGFMAYRLARRRAARTALAATATPPTPAVWVDPPKAGTVVSTAPDDPPSAPPAEAVAPGREPATVEPPFAIDLAQPLRITWPLDVGPDISPDRADGRLCLRARQGANEFLTKGSGDALYAFRLAAPARCRLWLRARYCNDGVGDVECNNTFLVSFDEGGRTLVGNDSTRSSWRWRRGPVAELGPGLHWLRIELREDGPIADRAVLAAADASPGQGELDAVEPADLGGFAGQREPGEPQRPIGEVECFALPTASLAIGTGHTNEVTVCVSWQGREGKGFEGDIAVHCATAPGLAAKGHRHVTCGPTARFARHAIELVFPPDAPRRTHKVAVSVVDLKGQVVFREELSFLKGYAWAFLGPFRDAATASGRPGPRTKPLVDPALPCDRSPLLLANRADPAKLGLAGHPLASDQAPLQWKLVADGSCYDWTGAVDLRKVYGPVRGALAYAVTWIGSSHSISRRILSFQADDAGWLWVNGCRLVELPMDLPREANRLWTSGPLRRGPNPVVVKLTQDRFYWGFRFDVVDWHWHGRRRYVIAGMEPDAWPHP
jgi:hypothetical protein